MWGDTVTFYNVLSALLFLGSLRVLLIAIDASNLGGLLAAGCLVVVVFNDMLSTSNAIECTAETSYTLSLMIIDLINFVLLAIAVVVLDPAKNLFDVPLHNIAAYLGTSAFWLLLALYWLLLMLWTRIAYPKQAKRKRVLWQLSVAVAFIVEWLLQICGFDRTGLVVSVVVLLYLTIYLTWLRSFIGGTPAAAP